MTTRREEWQWMGKWERVLALAHSEDLGSQSSSLWVLGCINFRSGGSGAAQVLMWIMGGSRIAQAAESSRSHQRRVAVNAPSHQNSIQKPTQFLGSTRTPWPRAWRCERAIYQIVGRNQIMSWTWLHWHWLQDNSKYNKLLNSRVHGYCVAQTHAWIM